MLLLRYFVFAGAMLLGCFWALDAINGPSAPKAQQNDMASLEAWRAAEARKEASKDGRDTSAAVILPAVTPMAPTAERLAYERQIASNKIPAPATVSEVRSSSNDARAELTESVPVRQDADAAKTKPKAKRKVVGSKAVVATAQPRNSNLEFSGFFGRIFEN